MHAGEPGQQPFSALPQDVPGQVGQMRADVGHSAGFRGGSLGAPVVIAFQQQPVLQVVPAHVFQLAKLTAPH